MIAVRDIIVVRDVFNDAEPFLQTLRKFISGGFQLDFSTIFSTVFSTVVALSLSLLYSHFAFDSLFTFIAVDIRKITSTFAKIRLAIQMTLL